MMFDNKNDKKMPFLYIIINKNINHLHISKHILCCTQNSSNNI